MITVKEDTTLVGISELRVNIDKVLEEIKKHKVIIGKRNKPVAVLLDVERYNQMEQILEVLEDFALGYLAKKRVQNSQPADYLTLEEAKKKIKK